VRGIYKIETQNIQLIIQKKCTSTNSVALQQTLTIHLVILHKKNALKKWTSINIKQKHFSNLSLNLKDLGRIPY